MHVIETEKVYQFIPVFIQREKDKQFYQIANYLWGYARILVWYFDFNNSDQFLDYEQHFNQIITYSLTLNPSEDRE